MIKTPNYEFNVPELEDHFNIAWHNQNTIKIDKLLKEQSDNLSSTNTTLTDKINNDVTAEKDRAEDVEADLLSKINTVKDNVIDGIITPSKIADNATNVTGDKIATETVVPSIKVNNAVNSDTLNDKTESELNVNNAINADKLGNNLPSYYATKTSVDDVINGNSVVAESTHTLNSDNSIHADNSDNATHSDKSTDSDKLGNVDASSYALKTDVPNIKVNNSINSDNSDKLGSQLPSYYATKSSVDDVINGTTPVNKSIDSNTLNSKSESQLDVNSSLTSSDSSKLGGQLPSYYAKASDVEGIIGGDGKVKNASNADNANKLGNQLPEYYAKDSTVQGIINGSVVIAGNIENAKNASKLGGELPSFYAKESMIQDIIKGTQEVGKSNSTSFFNGYTSDHFAEALPVAMIICCANSTITREGWLQCDGRAVYRATYSRLFQAIGTKYGAGDGNRTFNLPNLTDRFVMGAGSNAWGAYVGAGLPNITGSTMLTSGQFFPIDAKWDGAFYINDEMRGRYPQQSTHEYNVGRLRFSASRSNSIYGNSTTVQPPAIAMYFYIKY